MKPPFRKLRGYAFDPSLSLQLATVDVNEIVYKVEWEDLENSPSGTTDVYPQGEYIEVIDFDPASGVFYPSVNLNDLYLLAQDGLNPSVSNPQFHQQMVYAVIMVTIKNFEKALGRKIQWAEHIHKKEGDNKMTYSFVKRLRVYPHALRQANAYYSPLKKALLFGYFPAITTGPSQIMPGYTVFTCLSHDIIAHETTHAILDGLHRRYIEPTHPDTRAFHEAFADIVALFQHFTFPEVLRQQIAQTRGDLFSQNLLGQLAQEFGKALGHYGSLRDAIGFTDPADGKWYLHAASPDEYSTKTEFHERGAILVSAVFEAFLSIYKRRIAGLLRLATGGSGILSAGELHPDLVDKLCEEASKTARQILQMCVRALDYCPPLDITFGDYLRAIITADTDVQPDDDRDYRVAFIEAFQKRGIFPQGLKSISAETLCYPNMVSSKENVIIFDDFLKNFKDEIGYLVRRKDIFDKTKDLIREKHEGLYQRINTEFIVSEEGKRFAELTGMLFALRENCEALGLNVSSNDIASFEIDKLWLASRATPNGKIINNVIVTLLQKRGVKMKFEEGAYSVDKYFVIDPTESMEEDSFVFRGGATLIFDLDCQRLRYAVKKDISDELRMKQQFQYAKGLQSDSSASAYFDDETLSSLSGPFAFMHSFSHS